ncbi:MAG TPA: imidazole glycerol phosphate synthase subunit HisH [Candidatus Aminicenantes bacterium]|nr:imidazole glycerol phosphate synthase subunit HisH [Candidatus Aminicenantes bacterium]
MNTMIVRTGAGNLFSLVAALERIGVRAGIADSPEQLVKADRVILPGVGEARSAMDFLAERRLDDVIKHFTIPVLGICLGMQMLCRRTEERNTPGMGVFDLAVQRFRGRGKVPHTGWNRVKEIHGPLFHGLEEGAWFYFVHSYYAGLSAWTTATCEHMGTFSAALERNNFYGVQFHPEKSGAVGQRLLENFCNLSGETHVKK